MPTQLTFTCSNSTVETLEKGVKYFDDVNDVVLVFSLLTLNIFHTFFYWKKTPFTYKLFRSLFIKQTGPSQIIKWMNPEEHND